MATVPIFCCWYLTTWRRTLAATSTPQPWKAEPETQDYGVGENSDATTEGDSPDIDVDEPCALECL